MATNQDITGFYKGELINIKFYGKDRDGTVIASPSSQVISLTMGSNDGASPDFEWTTSTGEITLTDAGTGEWSILLTPADLSSIVEGKTYYYNIWSELSATTPILQAKGQFKLLRSIEPS